MKELINIQRDLKCGKEQYNSFGKYKYRSCEDILEAVKPLLDKYGCWLTISDDICMSEILETTIVTIDKAPREISTLRTYIKATARITNTEGVSTSVSSFAKEPPVKSGMDASQITGAASSYARKYALNGLFLIDDTKDADYSPHQNEVSKPAQQPQGQVKDNINQPTSKPATEKQVNAIKVIAKKFGVDASYAVHEKFGKDKVEELTSKEASSLIEWMQNG